MTPRKQRTSEEMAALDKVEKWRPPAHDANSIYELMACQEVAWLRQNGILTDLDIYRIYDHKYLSYPSQIFDFTKNVIHLLTDIYLNKEKVELLGLKRINATKIIDHILQNDNEKDLEKLVDDLLKPGDVKKQPVQNHYKLFKDAIASIKESDSHGIKPPTAGC